LIIALTLQVATHYVEDLVYMSSGATAEDRFSSLFRNNSFPQFQFLGKL